MQWQPEQDHVGALMVSPDTIIDLAIIWGIAGLVCTTEAEHQRERGILSTFGIRKAYEKELQVAGYETND